MKVTRDNLRGADYDLIFTRDPGKFFEALLLNLLWSKGSENEAAQLEKYRYVFEQWLGHYTHFIRNEALSLNKVHEMVSDAEKRGSISSLSSLPMKRGLSGKRVDMDEVSRRLIELKGAA